MVFSQLPPDYASMQGELLYRWTANLEPETLFSLRRDDVLLASKRLYDAYAGIIDVAPLVRKHLVYAPPKSEEGGLYAQPDRSLVVTASMGDETASPRRFISTCRPRSYSGFLTSMPRRRTLRRGDVDELTMLVGGAFRFTVFSVYGSELGNVLYSESRTADARTMWHFRFDASLWPDYTHFYIELRQEGVEQELIDRIEYHVAEAVWGGARVAWRSSAGSVEHHTFPVVRHTEPVSETESRSIVVSSFEPRETISALCELGHAKQVWSCDGGVYEPIEIVKLKLREHGSLRAVEVEIKHRVR